MAKINVENRIRFKHGNSVAGINLILNGIKVGNIKYRQKLEKTVEEGIYEVQGQCFIFKSRKISVNVNKPQIDLQIKINITAIIIFAIINIITIIIPALPLLNPEIVESSKIIALFIGVGLVSMVMNILNWLLLMFNIIKVVEV